MAGAGELSAELVDTARTRGGSWLVEQADQGNLIGELRPLRRLAWLRLLGVVSGDSVENWVPELEAHRKHYAELLEGYRRETDVKAADPKLCNPLSRNVDNPYLKIQVNDELLKEIWKDVERTFPECQFLSSPESRKVLQMLLFHWCRSKNPSKSAAESYRQGMNELVAVLYAAVKQGEYGDSSSDASELGVQLCGGRHSEADTFACFVQLMDKGLRPMFLASGGQGGRAGRSPLGHLPGARREQGGPCSAILARCQFIFDTIVRNNDITLYEHLRKLEIEPQIFLLRWIRLLFCREFDLEETFLLWDGLFASSGQAQPPGALQYPRPAPGSGPEAAAVMKEASEASAALPLVDFAAAALLQRMRGQLLTLDESDCLSRLLKDGAAESARRLIESARQLHAAGGAAARPLPAPSVKEAPAASLPLGRPEQGLLPQRSDGTTSGLAEDPLRRGGQLLSAAAQGAQGLFQAGRQAYANMAPAAASSSDPLRSGQATAAPAAAGTSITQSIANWVDIDLWDSNRSSGNKSQDQLTELRKRAQAAEQERDEIKRKANEFILKKKAEWASQLAERDQKIQELSKKLEEAEAAARQASELQRQLGEAQEKLSALQAASTSSGPASSSKSCELQVPSEMVDDI
eukprot:TRINITY_DN26825_c0_g1_i2.p1 TRINITY_DN26825_c0_g1~~TRINITY_DN26825_c0_g1_i2.p1  ORF type:complete len:659 (-),score=163.45 TRINITY_DN26825_c0_g1_i2:42-1949(-)